MPVTAAIKREYEIYGVIEGDAGLFPRDVGNADFRKYLDFSEVPIGGDGTRYTAFPFAIALGGKVVGLYSSGPGHAASDRQIMFVYDPATGSVTTTTFVTDQAPDTFDTSLIVPLLANGQAITLKVWTIRNAGGVISVSTLSTQDVNGVSYAFWSAVKLAPNGTYYRTAYGGGKAGLFSSPNGLAPWTFVVDLFPQSGSLQFTETDIAWRADGTMLAVCREASGGTATGALYWITANGDGSTLSVPVLFTTAPINGVQPQLLALGNGDILMMASDRTGPSGSAGGALFYGANVTGIAAWRLPSGQAPAVANWTFRQMLAFFYSTDGGQPWPVLLPSGRVFAPFYARKSVGVDPIISSMIFDASAL